MVCNDWRCPAGGSVEQPTHAAAAKEFGRPSRGEGKERDHRFVGQFPNKKI